jgi:hypothetical protein
MILSGCFELETVRHPILDCFEVLGVPRPSFEDGQVQSRPKTPRWCGSRPDQVPDRPAPFAPGACLALRDGRTWRRYGYDDAGRLVWVRDAQHEDWLPYVEDLPIPKEARWYYDGDTLSGYKDFDGTLYRYDDYGRLIRIESKQHWIEIQRDGLGRIIESLTLKGVAGDQTECVAHHDPETGAPSTEHCVNDTTGAVTTRTVRWDPDQHLWEDHTVRDDAEYIRIWRCDSNGTAVDDLDAGFDAAGRLVRNRVSDPRCSDPLRRAYDADGALMAALSPCPQWSETVLSTVYANGRAVCQTHSSSNSFWFGTWPPFRRESISFCSGGCEGYYDTVQPYGPVSMAIPEWSRGRLSKLSLDANADGIIDEVIDLPAAYDSEGRLTRELVLGPYQVEQFDYRYDCE